MITTLADCSRAMTRGSKEQGRERPDSSWERKDDNSLEHVQGRAGESSIHTWCIRITEDCAWSNRIAGEPGGCAETSELSWANHRLSEVETMSGLNFIAGREPEDIFKGKGDWMWHWGINSAEMGGVDLSDTPNHSKVFHGQKFYDRLKII